MLKKSVIPSPRIVARRLLLGSLIASGAAPVLAGCAVPVTAAQLAEYGTRTYPGHSPEQVQRAATIALKTMGFPIVDETGGRIKTAPKVMMTVAASTGKYSAVAADSCLAWVIEVTPGRGGAVVHATMRPSQAGHSLEPTSVEAGFAERAYRDLYREIDSNLGGAPSKPAAVAVDAPAPGNRAQATSASHATKAGTAELAPAPAMAKQSSASAAAAPGSGGTAATTVSSATMGTEPSPSAGSVPPEGGPPPEEANPGGPSVAALLGYGFNDGLNVGFGVRGGYTLPARIYVGGMFMYHLGSSQTSGVLGTSVTSHVNVYYGGVEGGYDANVGRLVIRPYGGIGPAWASASVSSSGAGGLPPASANTSSTASHVAFWFGGTVLYPVSESFALGGDARVLLVSDYNTFNLIATGAYRF